MAGAVAVIKYKLGQAEQIFYVQHHQPKLQGLNHAAIGKAMLGCVRVGLVNLPPTSSGHTRSGQLNKKGGYEPRLPMPAARLISSLNHLYARQKSKLNLAVLKTANESKFP